MFSRCTDCSYAEQKCEHSVLCSLMIRKLVLRLLHCGLGLIYNLEGAFQNSPA